VSPLGVTRVEHLGSVHFAQWQAAAPALMAADSKVDTFYTLDPP
jgi:quinol monooxygenase YgiN